MDIPSIRIKSTCHKWHTNKRAQSQLLRTRHACQSNHICTDTRERTIPAATSQGPPKPPSSKKRSNFPEATCARFWAVDPVACAI